MDVTFITIHDLSPEARILYSSDSIVDILGHTPDEVVNNSVWDWFHPDEVPFAKAKHDRGVRLDKAAVLSYARIRNRQGEYVGCECCFSVVYDVMVCCTSVYRNGISSQKRAVDAPLIRRLFTSSPEDPRYHMLSHLSSKFTTSNDDRDHEPRAALFLNRFTRSLTVMYATSGIEQVIGISSEEMKGRSFYYCIQQNCLEDAVKVLESAKGNDSIAYMRFRFRDPRSEDASDATTSEESEDDVMTDVTYSDDESDLDNSHGGYTSHSTGESSSLDRSAHSSISVNDSGTEPPRNHRTDSGDSTHPSDTHEGVFGNGSDARSSTSSVATPQLEADNEPIELEAVISCTSDGLVVCLRRARPLIPGSTPNTQPTYPNGVFAAPWAPQPVFQPALPQPLPYPLGAQHPAMLHAGPSPAFQNAFMQSIREVAVFAWALTGINGSLVDYAKGSPSGQSQPSSGFPVWDPEKRLSVALSGYASGSGSSSSNDPFGDPGLS